MAFACIFPTVIHKFYIMSESLVPVILYSFIFAVIWVFAFLKPKYRQDLSTIMQDIRIL